MRFLLLVFLSSLSIICTAQKNDYDFGIYFGNDFTDDSVTVIINGVLVAHNIKLKAVMIDPKNLMINQDEHYLSVWPYHEEERMLKKIPMSDSILNLDIKMNRIWRNYKFDLNQGRIFYPSHSLIRVGWTVVKIFTIRQSKSGPIML